MRLNFLHSKIGLCICKSSSYILAIAVSWAYYTSTAFCLELSNHSDTIIELSSMKDNILPEESSELLKVLSEDLPRAGFSEEEWLSVRNDALNVLFRQKKHDSRLFKTFENSFKHTTNITWKNYLIQNIDKLYSIASSIEDINKVKSMLITSLNNTDRGISSTALLTLLRMKHEHMGKLYSPEYNAKRILDNKFFSYIDKATALNVILSLDNDSARNYALKFLHIDKENNNDSDKDLIFLKMASIHVLSACNNPNDKQLLISLKHSDDSRLRIATNIAINKLEKSTNH